MILEYLFLDTEHKEELQKYKYENIEINISFCEFNENDRLIMKIEEKITMKKLQNISQILMIIS